MGINLSTINQELKELRHERDMLTRKIDSLEKTAEAYRSEKIAKSSISAGKSARGIDIRPVIQQLFEKNENMPLQLKDIVKAVIKENPELDEGNVRRKMSYLIRDEQNFLENLEYGKYRMKK